MRISQSSKVFTHFCLFSAGIFKQSMGARNRVGIGLSYRPARLQSLAELVPWNRFLGSLKFKNSGSELKIKAACFKVLLLRLCRICRQIAPICTVQCIANPASCVQYISLNTETGNGAGNRSEKTGCDVIQNPAKQWNSSQLQSSQINDTMVCTIDNNRRAYIITTVKVCKYITFMRRKIKRIILETDGKCGEIKKK